MANDKKPGTIFAMGYVWISPEAILAFMESPDLATIPMGAAAPGMRFFLEQLESDTLKEVSDRMLDEP